MEMRRILTPTGSIYLHIDHTAHAYVKLIMDGVFGKDSFRNEIVWCYTGPSNTKRYFPRKHDTILWYTKDKNQWTFNNQAESLRTPYSEDFMNRRKYSEGQSGITAGYSEGRSKSEIESKYGKGKLVEDWWDDIGAGGQMPRSEYYGYPTEKPLKLYKRIIEASSNKGDVVLDPFCGCATTLVAAEQLERRWIGMDIWDGAYKAVLERLASEDLHVNDDEINAAQAQSHYKIGLSFGDVVCTTEIPERTDENNEAAPHFLTPNQIAREPWQKMSNATIKRILASAQKDMKGLIQCAGCGRTMEIEFMELDHIQPRSSRGENWITNRVLICKPCNLTKSDTLTIPGLVKTNKKYNWLKNPTRQKDAENSAARAAEMVKSQWIWSSSKELEDLVAAYETNA